jgi:hypothetical protein
MNAPDKIYLAESDKIRGEVMSNFASSTPFRIHDSITYIRKDALLEWAKNLKERWEEPPMSKHSPGSVYMLEQLIDKLNSM